MKNTIKYTFLSALFLGFVACDVDNTLPEIPGEPENTITLNAGSADFSNYVAIGASFTAGFTDGALFKAAQENSFPNIMAKKFAMLNGGAFTQPLMNDNIGGLITSTGIVAGQPRFYFNGTAPTRLNAVPTTILGAPAQGSNFKNFGIPGAKSFHFTFSGYGNPAGLVPPNVTANPYFVRMASNPSRSIISDAVAQMPTFFSLSEVGGNDVLDYAIAGGASGTVTPSATFNAVYNGMVDALTTTGAKGVVANIPYITSLPFFTTVPNNALEIDAATAANLTGFFKAVEGIMIQGLVTQGATLAQAQAIAKQYAITFNAGKNRFLIDVPASATNPLGFRQMTEDELLLLTINQGNLRNGYGSVVLTPQVLQVLGKLQAGQNITAQEGGLVLAAINGIDDKDALDTTELTTIKTATDAYNVTIKAKADEKGLAFVDFNTILKNATSTGLPFDRYTLTTSLVTGGLVGLDGIHLTGRGYALMANKMLEAIDNKYGSNFTKAKNGLAKADDHPTNYSPTLQ